MIKIKAVEGFVPLLLFYWHYLLQVSGNRVLPSAGNMDMTTQVGNKTSLLVIRQLSPVGIARIMRNNLSNRSLTVADASHLLNVAADLIMKFHLYQHLCSRLLLVCPKKCHRMVGIFNNLHTNRLLCHTKWALMVN